MENVTITGALAVFGGAISAIFASAFGIDPVAFVWGCLGCALGVPVAKKVGRIKVVLLFFAASLASALIGSAVAEHWVFGKTARNVLCLGSGLLFHLLVAKLVEKVQADGLLGLLDLFRRAKT